MENLPAIYNGITGFMQVDDKRSELRWQLQQMECREKDMTAQLNDEEASNPCRKRKHVVEYYLDQLGSFKAKAGTTLARYEGRRKFKRMLMGYYLDNDLKVGTELLGIADQLQREGLTRDEVCTRGVRLPVEQPIGRTANEIRTNALKAIRRRDSISIIGIHGDIGSGKTNIMKVLHNDVFDDLNSFKAVFWAGAPEGQPDVKSIQECLAQAMRFKFEDEDVVRRGSLLEKRLKDMAPGHVVLFLDNVKEEFLTTDVGIPVRSIANENFSCTLVFTATSEGVCNRMRCSTSRKFKMDLLPEDEARELFLHEVGWNTCTWSYDQRIQKVADDVARQCARNPLVITRIARSMMGKEDICEWRNRLNELMGVVENMDDDVAKILVQLRFSYICLKNVTIQRCFVASANVLFEGHQMANRELIQHWIAKGLIGKSHCRGLTGYKDHTATYDQGQTIINELQRVYLLEVSKLNGMEFVKMNKWIKKMAESI